MSLLAVYLIACGAFTLGRITYKPMEHEDQKIVSLIGPLTVFLLAPFLAGYGIIKYIVFLVLG